jgi:hypothetical protein
MREFQENADVNFNNLDFTCKSHILAKLGTSYKVSLWFPPNNFLGYFKDKFPQT